MSIHDFVCLLHFKDSFDELMKKIPDHHKFYPKTLVFDTFNFENHIVRNLKDKYYILKPSGGNCQKGIRVLENDKEMYLRISNYLDRYSLNDKKDKISNHKWVLQSLIPSYLYKLPDDTVGRKMMLRSYLLFKTKKEVYLYPDIIATIFCQQFRSAIKNYQNLNLIKQFYNEQKREFDPNKYYHNFKKLFGKEKYEKIWKQMVQVIQKFVKTIEGFNNLYINVLFGVDWLLDPDLNLWILEINNGPDLKAYKSVIPGCKVLADKQKLKLFVRV